MANDEQMPELRMDAYYYGFEPTGVRHIDLILSAVACAGKSFHSTEFWNDDASAYDVHTGSTPVEWIQDAADQAADLCASGHQVRAVEMLGELLAYDEWRMHNGGVVPDRFLGVINRARDAYRAALTPAPQPFAATPTAQEAVACLHGYCDAENCPACSQDQEVAQPTEDELDEAWKSGFNAGFGEAKLTAHPPQPSVSVAEAAVRALTECICDMEDAGINSPASAHAALHALLLDGFNEGSRAVLLIRAINPTTVLARATETPRAWLDVMGERVRQITAEGWTPEHDDTHVDGELSGAASAYAMSAAAAIQLRRDAPLREIPPFFMFDPSHWEPTNARRDLVKAGALILAEIERLDRAADKEGQPQ